MLIYLHTVYKNIFILFLAIILLLFSHKAFAGETYLMPLAGDDIVGGMQEVPIEPGDNISKIAQRYGIGYIELMRANPNINPNKMRAWDKIVIPTAYILPSGDRTGIVINISEMRLYYYSPQGDTVLTAPVAIGREGWETPVTTTKIVAKVEQPYWRVPESIKEYSASKGKPLPDIMPPGPDNPLGDYAIRLQLESYLIHGTNHPESIGTRVSSGCIRMYPHDIETLYLEVPVGTKVRIVNEPYKVGWHQGNLFLESHKPIKNGEEQVNVTPEDYRYIIDNQVKDNYGAYLNWNAINLKAKQQTGVPEQIM